MKNILKLSKSLTVLQLILLMVFISAQSNPAVGSYQVIDQPKEASSDSPVPQGEPAAVGAAVVVMAAGVIASGVAFAFGVMDGYLGAGESHLPVLEQYAYDRADFSDYDI